MMSVFQMQAQALANIDSSRSHASISAGAATYHYAGRFISCEKPSVVRQSLLRSYRHQRFRRKPRQAIRRDGASRDGKPARLRQDADIARGDDDKRVGVNIMQCHNSARLDGAVMPARNFLCKYASPAHKISISTPLWGALKRAPDIV